MMNLAALFLYASIQHGLPPDLLFSVCRIESAHDITKIHINDGGTDSYGICQVKLETARYLGFRGTIKDLMKPETNINYAAKYLKLQIRRYQSIQRGVVAYNRGNARHLTTSAYQRKVYQVWLTSGHSYSQFLSASP